MDLKPGLRNLITDVAGLKVGNAQDRTLKSGVTVLTADAPFTTAVHVMGGAPGTRETDLLAPDKTVTGVDALVLSGGSAFGLDAASGVADALHRAGRGFAVGDARVPIVPAAVLFDLLNGGDKDWKANPYRGLGVEALNDASGGFDLGSIGAGAGATIAGMKGGLGSASFVTDAGITVGALVAVNAVGSVCPPDQECFWAGGFEIGDEFGGLGAPEALSRPIGIADTKLATGPGEGANTTIAIIATDANLSKAELQRLAIAAHDGMARAIVPSHTPFDGDLIFAVSTGAREVSNPLIDTVLLGHVAATTLSRAIARAVYEATSEQGDVFPIWSETRAGFGRS